MPKRKIETLPVADQSRETLSPPKKQKIKKDTEEVKVEAGVPDKAKKKPQIQQEDDAKPAKRKRKTQEEKAAARESMPLRPRSLNPKLLLGAHVSAAGGPQNSIPNSLHIGANAFALFLKSQRKWVNPPLLDSHALAFQDGCREHGYDAKKQVVPHGSYLVNLAHLDAARTEQAYASYLDDLKRCESLGIGLYNLHPGNTVKNDRAEAIAHLAKNLNRANAETEGVVTLLENMAAGGNVLGSTFEDLRDVIALVEDKERVGVCIDTCHAFAAGYDLRTPEAFRTTLEHFDGVVGLKYLRAMHLNDSKAPFGSHRDLHANIGTGFLGLRAFHCVVNEPRLEGLPMVLETPITVRDESGNVVLDEKKKEKEDKGIWAGEIELLERLVGMDVEGEEFLSLEKRLARKGEGERKRLEEQIGRKREKEEKKKKRKGKGRKGDVENDESELSEEEQG